MSNPYSEFELKDFTNDKLVYETMSNYVDSISNSSGDWSWSDKQKYVDMQSQFLDERLQELSNCNCGNNRCTVDGVCGKRYELEREIGRVYKLLDL